MMQDDFYRDTWAVAPVVEIAHLQRRMGQRVRAFEGSTPQDANTVSGSASAVYA